MKHRHERSVPELTAPAACGMAPCTPFWAPHPELAITVALPHRCTCLNGTRFSGLSPSAIKMKSHAKRTVPSGPPPPSARGWTYRLFLTRGRSDGLSPLKSHKKTTASVSGHVYLGRSHLPCRDVTPWRGRGGEGPRPTHRPRSEPGSRDPSLEPREEPTTGPAAWPQPQERL